MHIDSTKELCRRKFHYCEAYTLLFDSEAEALENFLKVLLSCHGALPLV